MKKATAASVEVQWLSKSSLIIFIARLYYHIILLTLTLSILFRRNARVLLEIFTK